MGREELGRRKAHGSRGCGVLPRDGGVECCLETGVWSVA